MTPTKGKAQHTPQVSHTSGPWERRTLVDGSNEVHSERGMVADVCTPTHTTRAHYITVRESEANAHLISSAPSLLKAVHGLIWLHNNRHNHADPKFLEFLDAAAEDAQAAIKLAEGE